MKIQLCIECNYSHGKHAQGCPEDVADEGDEASPILVGCRCCGMDADCVVERAGPICRECAPLLSAA